MPAIIHTFGFGGSVGAGLATVSPVYTSGNVWFLHSVTGTDAGGNSGLSRQAPLATLAQAQTNATAGDTIVALSGHTETLGTKLTLSKAGLTILGEGQGSSAPTFGRSADVNLFDLTGASIWLENIRFATDTTAGFVDDRVKVSANSCRLTGCYFAMTNTDNAAAAVNVANAVTNLTIDGATQFIAAGTSKTATAYQAIFLAGTATDLELNDVVIDGGTYGWLNFSIQTTGAVTRLRARNVDLLNGSDVSLAASTTGYLHVRAETGASRVVWT